ncbi:hypothetical protein FRACA_410013 [Frankia canadensis]|uniref:Uncharacterized protein n=1 Tax=Frankia canadensis TaxID=1836972 RepID=A0A2I2KWU9_9ACTN|nr:hypothetical protein FRACA_410013 [Frankia canadensis]SOU57429.1 hypothetical protein FRACA_410013 [Frankia canadensis]
MSVSDTATAASDNAGPRWSTSHRCRLRSNAVGVPPRRKTATVSAISATPDEAATSRRVLPYLSGRAAGGRIDPSGVARIGGPPDARVAGRRCRHGGSWTESLRGPACEDRPCSSPGPAASDPRRRALSRHIVLT